MIKKTMKISSYICILFVTLFFLGVSNSEANAINWNYEWEQTSARIWNPLTPPIPTYIDVNSSGRIEVEKHIKESEILVKNFEFTFIDALGDEYNWHHYNVSDAFTIDIWADKLYLDVHLWSGNVYNVQEPWDHDIWIADVGDPGVPIDSTITHFEMIGIHLNGNWNPVPEPSTMLLLISGLFGLCSSRKKLKK